MSISRRLLCIAYTIIGLMALVATWGNNLQYLSYGLIGGTLHFWQETLVNPASRSITVDIFFYSLAVTVWMLMEARRLKMRGVWLYVVFGVLVAVSVTFPIFMINRERALAAHDNTQIGGTLTQVEVVALLAMTAGFVAFTVITLLK